MKIFVNCTSKHLPICLCIVLVTLFTYGCYPVHSIENYPSKADYYKEANSAFEGKEVKVCLVQSDSTFYGEDAVIINDSIRLATSKEWEPRQLKRSDIISAKYFYKDYDNLCAQFKMLSGDTLNLEKIVFNPDSSIDYQVLNIKTVKLPLNDIKYIRYKNYRGIPAGLILGTIVGITTGNIWRQYEKNRPKPAEDVNHPRMGGEGDDQFGYLFWPSVAGPPIGVIVGWIIGGRTTWEFNK
jgi:hypothetical protein